MLSKVFLVALAASPLVAAHGRVAVMTGDAGGNTTALGILGGVVPGTGADSQTEVDTTVFKSRKALSDGLGETTAGGENTLDGMSAVIAQSGSTLPQVSDGGSISGTMHIVTTDGAGPYTAVIDSTGTGAFSQGTEATVTTQVPGNNGNIAATKENFIPRMLIKAGLMKRAANVNKDYPFAATIPAGTTCSGTVAGQSNVCLMKIVNPSGNGPFGGVIAMQIAGTAAAASNSTAEAATASADTTAAAATDADIADAATLAKAGKAPKARPIGVKFRA